jgi:hypothetical protein
MIDACIFGPAILKISTPPLCCSRSVRPNISQWCSRHSSTHPKELDQSLF